MGDAVSYDAWAQGIAAGNWLGNDVFYQAPLYPYFLGALFFVVGHNLIAVRVVQALLGALSCGLLSLAATRLFGTRAGLTAGLLLAIYAPAVYFDALIQKTTLDSVLLCGLLAVLASSQRVTTIRSLGLGILLGALALTRENTLLFVPLVGAWLWWRTDRGFRPLAALAGGIALLLVPVALRNFSIDGNIHVTTSQFGTNLFIGNSATANGGYVPLRNDHGTPEFERADAVELAQSAVGRQLSSSEVSAYWRNRAVAWAVENPGAWLRLMGKKLLLTWNVVEIADTEDIYSAADYSWPLKSSLLPSFWHPGTRWSGRDVAGATALARTVDLLCDVRGLFAQHRAVLRVCALSISTRAVARDLCGLCADRGSVVVAAPRIHGSPDGGRDCGGCGRSVQLATAVGR